MQQNINYKPSVPIFFLITTQLTVRSFWFRSKEWSITFISPGNANGIFKQSLKIDNHSILESLVTGDSAANCLFHLCIWLLHTASPLGYCPTYFTLMNAVLMWSALYIISIPVADIHIALPLGMILPAAPMGVEGGWCQVRIGTNY